MAEENQENKSSSLPAVVAGVLIILAGFLVYNFFTKSNKDQTSISFESTEAEQSENTQNKINNGQPTAQEENLILGTQESKPSQLTADEISNWRPRFISVEEVAANTYTVVKGDTLWNIAQAKYGSGFERTKILEANEETVEFLPDGTQARIEIGTVLVLP